MSTNATPSSVSVISGGSRGLGLAIVSRLLARGDRVATFSRSGSPALAALAASYPDHLLVESIDAADASAVRGFVDRVAARFGRIDHCIANAAIAHEGVLATARDDEIDAMLSVNVKGAIVLVRECVRQMLLGDASGRTVTLVSSVVARSGSPGLSVYAATKAALEGFGRSLARELGPRGIRVNCVAPGFLETDLSASLSQENRSRIARRTALGRVGESADVAGVVDFLSGPGSEFVTGHVLGVDGGA
ncbi:MAG: SDR family NAD(P)-dependent oxidoreductase [Planctomycetia bacterium]